MTNNRGGNTVARSRAGFSLVEIALVTVFLLVAVGGLSSAVISALKLSRTTEETSLADDASRALGSQMQTLPFGDVFQTYNADPADDPLGPGTAPGAGFDVRGLTVRTGDPDGRVGRILFPTETIGAGPAQALREDVVDPRLGMDEAGRDLNGDGAVDGLDHAQDYAVLPLRIIVEWTGAGGDRQLELDLCLVP